MIEQLDQALIKTQSMVAAQMQASMSEKSESIKFKAKDQALIAILSKHVLHKQPAMATKHRFMQRWKSQKAALARKSHHQDWQNEQIATVIKEKQDLEKKVEEQNELNEHLQAEISQVLVHTECQDCK